jgi:hypothetical protein
MKRAQTQARAREVLIAEAYELICDYGARHFSDQRMCRLDGLLQPGTSVVATRNP